MRNSVKAAEIYKWCESNGISLENIIKELEELKTIAGSLVELDKPTEKLSGESIDVQGNPADEQNKRDQVLDEYQQKRDQILSMFSTDAKQKQHMIHDISKIIEEMDTTNPPLTPEMVQRLQDLHSMVEMVYRSAKAGPIIWVPFPDQNKPFERLI
ncbi:hypothetical protein IWQ61_010313, partial [Dispira simplex]